MSCTAVKCVSRINPRYIYNWHKKVLMQFTGNCFSLRCYFYSIVPISFTADSALQCFNNMIVETVIIPVWCMKIWTGFAEEKSVKVGIWLISWDEREHPWPKTLIIKKNTGAKETHSKEVRANCKQNKMAAQGAGTWKSLSINLWNGTSEWHKDLWHCHHLYHTMPS